MSQTGGVVQDVVQDNANPLAGQGLGVAQEKLNQQLGGDSRNDSESVVENTGNTNGATNTPVAAEGGGLADLPNLGKHRKGGSTGGGSSLGDPAADFLDTEHAPHVGDPKAKGYSKIEDDPNSQLFDELLEAIGVANIEEINLDDVLRKSSQNREQVLRVIEKISQTFFPLKKFFTWNALVANSVGIEPFFSIFQGITDWKAIKMMLNDDNPGLLVKILAVVILGPLLGANLYGDCNSVTIAKDAAAKALGAGNIFFGKKLEVLLKKGRYDLVLDAKVDKTPNKNPFYLVWSEEAKSFIYKVKTPKDREVIDSITKADLVKILGEVRTAEIINLVKTKQTDRLKKDHLEEILKFTTRKGHTESAVGTPKEVLIKILCAGLFANAQISYGSLAIADGIGSAAIIPGEGNFLNFIRQLLTGYFGVSGLVYYNAFLTDKRCVATFYAIHKAFPDLSTRELAQTAGWIARFCTGMGEFIRKNGVTDILLQPAMATETANELTTSTLLRTTLAMYTVYAILTDPAIFNWDWDDPRVWAAMKATGFTTAVDTIFSRTQISFEKNLGNREFSWLSPAFFRWGAYKDIYDNLGITHTFDELNEKVVARFITSSDELDEAYQHNKRVKRSSNQVNGYQALAVDPAENYKKTILYAYPSKGALVMDILMTLSRGFGLWMFCKDAPQNLGFDFRDSSFNFFHLDHELVSKLFGVGVTLLSAHNRIGRRYVQLGQSFKEKKQEVNEARTTSSLKRSFEAGLSSEVKDSSVLHTVDIHEAKGNGDSKVELVGPKQKKEKLEEFFKKVAKAKQDRTAEMAEPIEKDRDHLNACWWLTLGGRLSRMIGTPYNLKVINDELKKHTDFSFTKDQLIGIYLYVVVTYFMDNEQDVYVGPIAEGVADRNVRAWITAKKQQMEAQSYHQSNGQGPVSEPEANRPCVCGVCGCCVKTGRVTDFFRAAEQFPLEVLDEGAKKAGTPEGAKANLGYAGQFWNAIVNRLPEACHPYLKVKDPEQAPGLQRSYSVRF